MCWRSHAYTRASLSSQRVQVKSASIYPAGPSWMTKGAWKEKLRALSPFLEINRPLEIVAWSKVFNNFKVSHVIQMMWATRLQRKLIPRNWVSQGRRTEIKNGLDNQEQNPFTGRQIFWANLFLSNSELLGTVSSSLGRVNHTNNAYLLKAGHYLIYDTDWHRGLSEQKKPS